MAIGLERQHTALLIITIIAIASAVLEQQPHLASAQTCGYQANFLLCPKNQCCSQDGFCGHKPHPFCGTNCQSGACDGTEVPPASVRNRGHILFDYIGSSGRKIFFIDYPVNTSTTITYILGLAFAIDMNNTGAKQNGNFQVWRKTFISV